MLDARVTWGYIAYGWLGPVVVIYGDCALGIENLEDVLDVLCADDAA